MAVPLFPAPRSTYWISPTVHPSEAFECLDCYLIDHLDIHGRCQRCNSDAVFPFQILENRGRWLRINDVPYWFPTDPKYGREGVIKITVARQFKADRTGTDKKVAEVAAASVHDEKAA